MKKMIGTLLAVLMLSSTVIAAEVDLQSMSTEDLISLRLSIVEELMARGEMKSAKVPAGKYTIGTDIPAGSYSISTDQIMVTVMVNGYDQMYVVTPDDGVGKITLNDGNSFECSSTIVMTTYTGISFE